jgi:hypothetical protein
MKLHRWGLGWALSLGLLCSCSSGKQVLAWEGDTYVPWHGGPAYFAKWPSGLSSDPNFFHLSVWLQNPTNATRFEGAGINLFTGLWKGPTDDQMAALTMAAMPVICDQSSAYLSNPTIKAWLQPDGPDNAQEMPLGSGNFGPCMTPSSVVADYTRMVAADPSRPVYLSLGRGVAENDWIGRGPCTGHTEDYLEYVNGGDVLSFNDYVVNNGTPLENIATGMDNLLAWSGRKKPVVAIIEASDYSGKDRLTPEQVETEVWMAIVHGAAGIEYYCHRMEPTLDETYCLDVVPIRDMLTKINADIANLAPVLNTQSVANGVSVTSSDPAVPVDTMLKRYGGAIYLFAVAMRGSTTTATFHLGGIPENASAEVLGESRSIAVAGRDFRDQFAGYGVHRYRITY